MTQDLDAALSALTNGIYLLTTGSLERPGGMVVSWVTQVGGDPPLVAVAVRTNRFLHDLVPEYGVFGLNVLSADFLERMTEFKQALPGRQFDHLPLFTAATGAPLLENALACLDCRLAETIRPGDHSLFVGRVEAARVPRYGPPLTTQDYGRAYLGRK
ncbi:MAG: flavin reductase family protein [Proteobacteria bacterium]|nr:flavin reductase family protein [Pseudomonadota bacterium]